MPGVTMLSGWTRRLHTNLSARFRYRCSTSHRLWRGGTPAQAFRDLARPRAPRGAARIPSVCRVAEHHGDPGGRECRHGGGDRPRRRGHVDNSCWRRRHHAAKPFAATHRRTVRHVGRRCFPVVSTSDLAVRQDQIRLTARALRRDPTAADAFPHDVAELIAFLEPGETGPDGARGSRRRNTRTNLDSRVEFVRCAVRRGDGSSVRLRVALRPRALDAGDRDLSRAVSARLRSAA